MPSHDFTNIGDVLDFDILRGTITSVDSETDTCEVEVNGSTYEALLFYHCEPDSILRDNGAIEGAAAGFAVDDEVIVMVRKDNKIVKVIAHVDGVRHCGDLILRFMFNGQSANLGGEVIKIYYHPKNPLVAACSDIRCASAQDGETCIELYCLSKTQREQAISTKSYRTSEWDEPIAISFPDEWTETDIIGIPLTPLIRQDIDTDYPVRVVLSDKRKQTPEVYNHYYNLLQDLSIEHDVVRYDFPYMDMMCIYRASMAAQADYEEPIPVDNINEEVGYGCVPMFEAYTYTDGFYDSPDNYDYGTRVIENSCGGTPEGWWSGTLTTSQVRNYKTINPSNIVRAIELTIFEGSFNELFNGAKPFGASFSYNYGEQIVSPSVTTLHITCPDCIHRVKTTVTTTVEEKTVKSFYTGITVTPKRESVAHYMARVGSHDYGSMVNTTSCEASIEPAYGIAGSIAQYSETIQTMEYSGPLYPHITECEGGGSVSFGYSWSSSLTSISTYSTSTPGSTEYSIGGRETQIQDASPIQIPITF